MNYLHLCLAARVTRGDLKAIHAELESGSASQPIRLVLLKAAILAVANVADLEARSGSLYKQHPDLAAIYQPRRKQFEFAKYLRNKAVGHFVEGLTAQTFGWKPELYAVLKERRCRR